MNELKCIRCKKRCKCRFCPENDTCKYATKKNCKAVYYCGRLERNHESKENN